MLSSLLPGLRDLRAPLAAGFVWLVALWFLFEPRWNSNQETDGFMGSANRLMSTLNLIGQGVVLSFTAYLIGSFSVFLFSRTLTSRFRTSIEPSGRLLQGLSDLGRVSLAQVAVDGRKRLEEALTLSGITVDEILGLVAPVSDQPRKTLRGRRGQPERQAMLTSTTVFPTPEQRQEREISERVLRDLPVVATAQLLGKEPEVFAAVDRSQAEVEFRAALVPAVLALAGSIAFTVWPQWPLAGVLAVLVGVLGAAGLMLDAARGRRDSNEMILSLMEHGRITPPSVLRAESEAVARGDQSPAVVVKRQGDEVARAVRRYITSLDQIPSSGSLPMLDQAHAAAADALKQARELDRLLELHDAVPPGSPPTTSVLEPIDRALGGWTAMNASLTDHIENPAVSWGENDPPPEQLRGLVDEGQERYRAVIEKIRKAAAVLANREVKPANREVKPADREDKPPRPEA
jgi:hypothetical protein